MNDLDALSNLIMNNGVGVVCLAYTLYTSYKVQNEMQKTLNELKELIQKVLLKIEEDN